MNTWRINMDKTPTKSDAILALRPNGGFSVSGDGVVEYLHEGDPEPTEEEIQAKLAELQAEYEANQYQRDREISYPSIQEQLDMQYWDAVNGTNKWQEAVAKVKADNPKPE